MEKSWAEFNSNFVNRAYIKGIPNLYVADPEIIKAILVKDFHLWPNRVQYRTDNDFFNNQLPMTTGEKWRRLRILLSPTFTTRKMKRIFQNTNSCIDNLVAHFKQIDQANVDIKKSFRMFTMDVVFTTAFGTKVNPYTDAKNPLIRAVEDLQKPKQLLFSYLFPMFAKFFRIKTVSEDPLKCFIDVLDKIISQRQNQPNVTHNDFLQLLLDVQMGDNVEETTTSDDVGPQHLQVIGEESPKNDTRFTLKDKKLSQIELQAQCLQFWSSASAPLGDILSFTAYLLALNPDKQDQLFDEIKRVWDADREFSYDNVMKLDYLDACVSEVLRMYNPGIAAERVAAQDLTIPVINLDVTKGFVVRVPIYAMHRDPEFFPDPDQFKPERFLPENRHQIRPFTYIPFGAGPRHCIAMRFVLMEVKLTMAHLLFQFKFERSSSTDVPIKLVHTMTLSAQNVILKVSKRDAN